MDCRNYGTQVLNTNSISNFVAFGSLNSSKVKGWVESAMGTNEVARWKEILKTMIAEKISTETEIKTIE